VFEKVQIAIDKSQVEEEAGVQDGPILVDTGQGVNLLDPFALPSDSGASSVTEAGSKRNIVQRIFSRGNNQKTKQSDAGSEDEPPPSSSSYLDPFSNN
jgi:hypothetical protein